MRGLSVCVVGGLVVAALCLSVSTASAAPSITSLSPGSGAVGAQVTIAGSGFGSTQGSSTVKFGNTQATAVASWSTTQIVVAVPSMATGSVNVVVRVSNSNSNAVAFTLVAAPTITSLSPTGGAVGASVTIAGSNFGTTQGTGTVTFNTTAATPSSWGATSITVPVPAGATTGNVVVQASGVNSNGSTFTVAPAIAALSATSGGAGGTLTLTGTNFGATQGTSTVTFNGVTASTTAWSSTSITAVVPAGATSGPVVASVGSYSSNGVSFAVEPAPAITGVTPVSGAVGATLVISGTGFGATQGSGSVTVGGVTATPTAWSATSVTTSVPAGASTGSVVVRASGVTSNSTAFTVVPPPAISGLSTSGGPVGSPVVITGTHFGSTQGQGRVRFNDIVAAVAGWADGRITVAVPSGATTGSVMVDQSGVTSNGVLFTVGQAPQITTIAPAASTIGGAVTIGGTHFGTTAAGGSVRFGDRSAQVLTWTDTSIVVIVPAGGAGEVTVRAAGVPSNRVAFTLLTTLQGVNASAATARDGYTGRATVTFARPRRTQAAPRGLEVQFAWYRASGEVFAVDRFLLSDLGALPTASVHSSVAATVAPPWRVVVSAREMLVDVPLGNPLASCNSDLPYPGQPACTTDTRPAALGPVLADTTTEVAVGAP